MNHSNFRLWRSNRTFMELKLKWQELCRNRHSCSNRTFMELKYSLASQWETEISVLIVPLWN